MIQKRGLLLMCVANSARSQMAEGLARKLSKGSEWEIYSAGSEPQRVNPYAILAMAEIGIDLGVHQSKSVADIPQERIATVITLCAEEVCPIFPGQVKRLHWPMSDPAAATGSDLDILQSFRTVREQIQQRLAEFFQQHPNPNA
jgi:arsenate reductase